MHVVGVISRNDRSTVYVWTNAFMSRARRACTGLLPRPIALACRWGVFVTRDISVTWMSTGSAYAHRSATFSEEASRQRLSRDQHSHEISVEVHGHHLLKQQGFKPGALIKDLEAKRSAEALDSIPVATAENPFVAATVNGSVVGLSDEINVDGPSARVELLRFGDNLGKKVGGIAFTRLLSTVHFVLAGVLA
jgi:hypothetical protein